MILSNDYNGEFKGVGGGNSDKYGDSCYEEDAILFDCVWDQFRKVPALKMRVEPMHTCM